MLVFIIIRQIHLADPAQSAIAVNLSKDSNFDSPVPRDSYPPCELDIHRKFTSKDVPEAVEVIQKLM